MRKIFLKATSCALALMLLAAPAIRFGEFPAIVPSAALLAVNGDAAPAAAASGMSERYPFSKIQIRIADYREVNPDVAGWLTVPGTNIHEPVMLSAKSNNYYVQRDWRGTNYPNITWQNWDQYPATATYADRRVQFGKGWKNNTSRNIVLYGHNWNNLRDPLKIGNVEGYTMFAQLPSYTSKKFASKNPYIYFSTGEYEGVWKVFSVAYCEVKTSFIYNSPNPSKEAFGKLIEEWQSRSMYNFNVDVNDKDRLLTLSTCTRQYANMGDRQRFVVVARLLRDGESEKDAVAVEVNEKMKKPQF